MILLYHWRALRCLNSALSFVEPAIRGLLHIDLSLGSAAAIAELRIAWVDGNINRTVVKRGYPLTEDEEYIRLVLRYFIPGEKNGLVRSSVACSLSRGNWQNDEEIELIVPPDVDIGDEYSFKLKALILWSKLLIPRVPRRFDRKNWTGGEEAIGDVALPLSYHSSFKFAYKLMCERLVKTKHAAKGVGGLS